MKVKKYIDRATPAFAVVEEMLKNLRVEDLPEVMGDKIVGHYCDPEQKYMYGVIVGRDEANNWQFGCAHYISGHDTIQTIQVNDNQDANKPVAVYKVLRCKRDVECRVWINGNERVLKKGDVFEIMNGDSYCVAGNFVVAEVFEPVHTDVTHLSVGVDNPLLKTADETAGTTSV